MTDDFYLRYEEASAQKATTSGVSGNGFCTDFNLNISFTPEAEYSFWHRLIVFVEEQGLEIGGSLSSFYVTRAKRGTTTEVDRESLAAWLHQQAEVSNVKVWPLDDAWHGPFAWL